jgi:hypothetical protein
MLAPSCVSNAVYLTLGCCILIHSAPYGVRVLTHLHRVLVFRHERIANNNVMHISQWKVWIDRIIRIFASSEILVLCFEQSTLSPSKHATYRPSPPPLLATATKMSLFASISFPLFRRLTVLWHMQMQVLMNVPARLASTTVHAPIGSTCLRAVVHWDSLESCVRLVRDRDSCRRNCCLV